MNNKDWWKVDNLKKSEDRIRNIDNFDNSEDHGDFGSYKKILNGASLENTSLATHNDLSSKNKIIYIDKLIKTNKNKRLQILDAGCGAGFTANELSIFYNNSNVVGVDISTDGIKYAQKNFSNVKFICQGIDPKNQPIGEFDLIYCFEFYPFTRTNSLEDHKEYLIYFLSQLKKNGKLILHQRWENKDSISSNIDLIEKELIKYQFTINRVPHASIISLFKFRNISLFLDIIIRLILRKDHMKTIIISKK